MILELLIILHVNSCLITNCLPSWRVSLYGVFLVRSALTIPVFKMQLPQIPCSPHPTLFSPFPYTYYLLNLCNFLFMISIFLLYISNEIRNKKLQRINVCKVPYWSKIGRLKRSNMPKLGVIIIFKILLLYLTFYMLLWLGIGCLVTGHLNFVTKHLFLWIQHFIGKSQWWFFKSAVGL